MERDRLTVGFFRPEDAGGVAKLFTEVYGNAYPAKIVYNQEELIHAVSRRDQIPIVVRTSENRVVGYSSLYRVAPDAGVYENGNGAVSADFRNAGIMTLIFQFVRKMLPEMDDVKVFFGEPVCNHIYIQKAALSVLPMVETALEIDLMPAEAYDMEKSAAGRVSTLLMFMTVLPRPHMVHVPKIYGDWFRYIYEGLDDRRIFLPSEEAIPLSPLTRIDTEIFESAGVARMAVHEAGSDFETALLAEEGRILSRDAEVLQVWLKLSCPWIGRIVEVLRGKGYFFGGILPQWFGDDGLLMQKIVLPPNWAGIHLFTERARKILEFARADSEEVG